MRTPRSKTSQATPERLQKALAEAGVASRRASEELIRGGRVTVNGVVVSELGAKVEPGDQLAVDGQPVTRRSSRTYILLHKPIGYVTTASDPEGRPTVLDLVASRQAGKTPGPTAGAAQQPRLFPVGRLDFDSEGLVLLTDDGDLTFRLTHPSFEMEKEYRALVRGAPTGEALERLRSGVELDGQLTAPALVTMEPVPEAKNTAPAWTRTRQRTKRPGGVSSQAATWLRFVIHEGRNRQIRRMCMAVGFPVVRLIRVRLDGLELGDLRPGAWRALSGREITSLKKYAGRAGADAHVPRGGA